MRKAVVLFGTVILIAVLGITGCSQPVSAPQSGVGYVSLSIPGVASQQNARTALPSGFTFTSYKLVFTKAEGGGDPVERSPTTLSETIPLAPGTWNLALTAYIGEAIEGNIAATGTKTGILVTDGNIVPVEVKITFSSLTGTGTLSYNITKPDGITPATAKIVLKRLDTSADDIEINLLPSAVYAGTGAQEEIDAGYYWAVVTLETTINGNADRKAAWSEAIHIYNGQTTNFAHQFAETDFNRVIEKIWLVGLADPWTLPGTEISKPDGTFSWEGNVTTVPATFRFSLTDTTGESDPWVGDWFYPQTNLTTVGTTVPYEMEFIARTKLENGAWQFTETGYYRISVNPGTLIMTVTKPPHVTGVTINESNVTVEQGAESTFSATVAGENLSDSDKTVTWTVTGAANAGTIIGETTGLLIIADDETATSLTVKATSTVDITKENTITVTVIPKGSTPTVESVTVTAAGGVTEIARGATLQFTADVTGANNPSQNVTWSVAGKDKTGASVALTGTSIDEDGLLTVGTNETAVDLVVTAASTVTGFTNKEGTAQVFVRKYGDVYLIGDDFGGWTPPVSGSYAGTEMTSGNRGVYTWTGIMYPNKTFKFHDDTVADYNTGNWFNASGEDIEPTGELQVTFATASGLNNSWKTTKVGNYDISLDTTAGTVTFTRTELGATGSITLSIEDKGKGLELTKPAGDFVMYKRGTLNSLTFTVTTEGYNYTWYVDGVQKGTGGTITLEAAGYNIGGHSVTLVAKNTTTNVFWSADPIQFKVAAKEPAEE